MQSAMVNTNDSGNAHIGLLTCERIYLWPILFYGYNAGQDRFDSLQVVRNLITSIKNFVHELPHKLPSDSRASLRK